MNRFASAVVAADGCNPGPWMALYPWTLQAELTVMLVPMMLWVLEEVFSDALRIFVVVQFCVFPWQYALVCYLCSRLRTCPAAAAEVAAVSAGAAPAAASADVEERSPAAAVS